MPPLDVVRQTNASSLPNGTFDKFQSIESTSPFRSQIRVQKDRHNGLWWCRNAHVSFNGRHIPIRSSRLSARNAYASD